MNLTLNWINLLILFGASQALIFSIILVFHKKHPGSKFLAAFVFILAYNGFETFNWSAGLDRYYLFFDMFGFIVIYGLGPSLYLYITSMLYPDRKITGRRIAAHYSLVILQFTARIAIIIYHLLWINKIIVSEVHSGHLMNIVWFYAEPLSVLVFLAYLVASVYEFIKFKKTGQIKSIGKEGTQLVFNWIRSLLFCLVLFAIFWVLTVTVPYFVKLSLDSTYYPIELGLVLFIYWLAFNGFHKMKLIYLRPVLQPETLNAAEQEDHFNRLLKAMETEKLYLDPELNLAKLSSHTGIPAKSISSLLNQRHQTSFNDFINGYRVKEVSTMMITPGNQHFTISGIAFEAGFNSQATFQRAFKKQTGMSPREFMNRGLEKAV